MDRKSLTKFVIDKCKLLVVAYLIAIALLYVAQDALIFHPRLADQDTIKYLESHPDVEKLTLKTTDNTELAGWFRHATGATAAPTVLYFGGNAEEISDTIANWTLSGVSIAALNYRGYGMSGGSPSQEALFQDALAFYDAIASRPQVNKDQIRIMGWSLGSGVAAYVASERKVEKLVLLMPYDSVASVAQEIYPIIPVNLLLKNRFDTLSFVSKISAPTLVIAADQDRVIPKNHAENLVAHWPRPPQFYIAQDSRHEDSYYSESVRPMVERFIGVGVKVEVNTHFSSSQ